MQNLQCPQERGPDEQPGTIVAVQTVSRYTIITLTKTDARQIDMCCDCGLLVLSRTVHDAWHALCDPLIDAAYTPPGCRDGDLTMDGGERPTPVGD